MKKGILSSILAVSAASLIASCGGGGGGSSSTTTTTLQGQFVDAPVAGLEYSTSSGITGVTDANGYFSYREGDTVTFKIGKITLGDAKADKVVTPSTLFADELANGKIDLTTLENKVKQIVALLLLLDSNPNDDKIEIPDDMKIKLDNITLEIDIERDDLNNLTIEIDVDDDGYEENLSEEIKYKEYEAEEHYSGTLYTRLKEALKDMRDDKFYFRKYSGTSEYTDCTTCTLSYDGVSDSFSFSCDNGDSDTVNISTDVNTGNVYLISSSNGKKNLLISASDDKICFIPEDAQNEYFCIVEDSYPPNCNYDTKDYTYLISGKVEGIEMDDELKIRIVPENHWVEGDYNGIVCDISYSGVFGDRCILYAQESDFNSENNCQVIVFEDENYNWRFDKEEDDEVKLSTTINCAQLKDIVLRPDSYYYDDNYNDSYNNEYISYQLPTLQDFENFLTSLGSSVFIINKSTNGYQTISVDTTNNTFTIGNLLNFVYGALNNGIPYVKETNDTTVNPVPYVSSNVACVDEYSSYDTCMVKNPFYLNNSDNVQNSIVGMWKRYDFSKDYDYNYRLEVEDSRSCIEFRNDGSVIYYDKSDGKTSYDNYTVNSDGSVYIDISNEIINYYILEKIDDNRLLVYTIWKYPDGTFDDADFKLWEKVQTCN